MGSDRHNRKLRRALLAGASVVLLAVAGFTTWQALSVRSSLSAVAADLSAVSSRLAAGETAAAAAALDSARSSAAEAHDKSRGPVWWLGTKLPWVGDDVTAVRVVSEVADDLTSGTLPELVDASERFGPDALKPRRGRVDVVPVREVAPLLAAGADDIEAAAAKVDTIETAGLMPALRGPVFDLAAKLDEAGRLSTHAATAARLLPTMLGGEGPRTYLVIFQNNAEIRAQGGMPGALALVRAEDGRLSMVKQGAPGTIGSFEEGFIDLTAEERVLFTERVSVYPQDAVFIPDFARSSQILKRMWEERQPETIDGVISLDPVALGYLLRGTGPVTLSTGQQLTADNAVDELLRDVYLEVPDLAQQNAIFAETARKVFDALAAGKGDPRAVLSGLSKAAGERRLMIWSASPEEQERLAGTAISGDLPTQATARPEIGVYLNDSSADKLSYYLDYSVDVTPRSCGGTGSQVLDVSVTMRSTVPPGATLTPSVVGPPTNRVPPGVMLNSLYLYGPVDGRISSATLDGEKAPMNVLTYRGREVGAITLDLEPGEERVVDYELRTGPGQDGTPHLVTTPAALTTGHGKVAASAC